VPCTYFITVHIFIIQSECTLEFSVMCVYAWLAGCDVCSINNVCELMSDVRIVAAGCYIHEPNKRLTHGLYQCFTVMQ